MFHSLNPTVCGRNGQMMLNSRDVNPLLVFQFPISTKQHALRQEGSPDF